MIGSGADPMKHMSCQPSRDQFAEILRQFASGRLTNDEFEDGYNELPCDSVVNDIFRFVWMFYDSMSTHRLRGSYRLSLAQRQVFARCVLFLKSGLPYDWRRSDVRLWCAQLDKVEKDALNHVPWWKPDPEDFRLSSGWWLIFSRRLRTKLARREAQLEAEMKKGMIDDRIWPFRRMSDYKTALKNPPYLCGV
jgi:hypothetical protein